MMEPVSVLQVAKDNAKMQREAARGFRRDSQLSLERASRADEAAEQWERMALAYEQTVGRSS